MEKEKNTRGLDSYEFYAAKGSEETLIDEVNLMEKNSQWIPAILSKDIKAMAIDGAALFADETSDQPLITTSACVRYGMDPDLVEETTNYGMGIAVGLGHEVALMRDTCYDGLCNAVKISGSALTNLLKKDRKTEAGIDGRVGFSVIINTAATVARGTSLALMRYGKLSALHSNADSGYEVMPITRLMEISMKALRDRFGTVEFEEGYNSHSLTVAKWSLPDAQSRLLSMYQKAIDANGGSLYAMNAMPVVAFSSSDTSESSATLRPMFRLGRNGTCISFCDPIKVKHTKRGHGNKSALEDFEEQAGKLYAKFEESAELIAELASITIFNPCNCVVSLCNKFDIAKKYGEAARAEVEDISGGAPMSAHDVYLSMTEAIAEAIRLGASEQTITRLEEAVAKTLHADWTEHDVGGVVAWKSSIAA